MKILTLLLMALVFAGMAKAEDGHQLWLRQQPINKAKVTGPECIAAQELRTYSTQNVTLKIDATMEQDAYCIKVNSEQGKVNSVISAKNEIGLLYGAYALLRGETTGSEPFYKLRILNHWDNMNGTIERGYAGLSIFWKGKAGERKFHGRTIFVEDPDQPIDAELIKEYARANASIGINGTVLNNVNASPKMLSAIYINKVKQYADILRPYGIKVYLSVNFASPMSIPAKGFNGGKPIKTADPLNPKVKAWWKAKAKEIYAQIPDFGGFLVKANSEGQPGPFDYKRTHADGANMLADAVKPFGGIIMWRSFVYGAAHSGEDRVKQAVSEFKDLDGKFRDNVILQSKNGPLDFQPREPYAPIFDNIKNTKQMAELQITQEYLGQSRHLTYLAPMWREFFGFVAPEKLVGIAGVANIGLDKNWCGHHFSQANWYAFGRLAWNPNLTSEQIAEEWLGLTFNASNNEALKSMMLRSREACVDYMMPIGLHHIFAFDEHYGPEPDGYNAHVPLEWCPVYYHKANNDSIGFNRTHTGSNATAQYREPYCTLYDNINTCPERYLLWFHRVPWSYRLKSGRTVLEEMDYRYARGVKEVEDFIRIWNETKPNIDEQRWQEVDARLQHQLENAKEWQKVCMDYFSSFTKK
ncbi:alpha-glucuronidase [Xylanibacter ruminicola]|uniref:Alpha-glucuronidase n=2 Tax=Xylanibacter ruminicola TaxID=839 RepID=D5EVE9_XYLR2|nr:alpha-glucuronidase [Xylanibacter ruminicola]ADE82923.1 putative alpha-glucuronidase [Xylanibacter ruminicola 23]SEH93435.1 alpha-glucuronidase [Xylanibacter ruminicola]